MVERRYALWVWVSAPKGRGDVGREVDERAIVIIREGCVYGARKRSIFDRELVASPKHFLRYSILDK